MLKNAVNLELRRWRETIGSEVESVGVFPAEVHGGLAVLLQQVTIEGREYVAPHVVHVASGIAVAPNRRSVQDARRTMARLLPLADWTRTGADLAADAALHARVREQW